MTRIATSRVPPWATENAGVCAPEARAAPWIVSVLAAWTVVAVTFTGQVRLYGGSLVACHIGLQVEMVMGRVWVVYGSGGWGQSVTMRADLTPRSTLEALVMSMG